LSDEDLAKHQESLLEGIFQDHISKRVCESISTKMSGVKTEAFLDNDNIGGLAVCLPEPLLALLGGDPDETAKAVHHRIIDSALESDLVYQAKQYLETCAYPYENVDQSASGLVVNLSMKMQDLPSTVDAKESWVRDSMTANIYDVLEVFDRYKAAPDPLDTEDAQLGDVVVEVTEPGSKMSLDWIRKREQEEKEYIYDEVVRFISEDTPGLDPSEVQAQASQRTAERTSKQVSDEEQHQKALDRLTAYFEENPPPADYASSVDLFPIVFEHNLRDDATGKDRATDPNGVRTVLTTGGEGDWSLKAFLPPPFSELLSQV
jgi:hypothetical protein